MSVCVSVCACVGEGGAQKVTTDQLSWHCDIAVWVIDGDYKPVVLGL